MKKMKQTMLTLLVVVLAGLGYIRLDQPPGESVTVGPVPEGSNRELRSTDLEGTGTKPTQERGLAKEREDRVEVKPVAPPETKVPPPSKAPSLEPGHSKPAPTPVVKPATSPKAEEGVWVKGPDGRENIAGTLDRIRRQEPFPHRNDGSVFQNRERRLPNQPRGYYREYVHPTRGVSGPGPQRVVIGRGGEVFYTPDHYETFERVKVDWGR